MELTTRAMSEKHNTAHEAKDIAFYTAAVQAWITTRMERDRALLSLSAGGIGLLVTLLTTLGASSDVQLWLYMAAAISFAGAIVFALLVFDRNSHYLRQIIKGKNPGDRWLIWCDRFLIAFFALGVLFTCTIGISSGYKRTGDSKMTQDNRMRPLDDDSTRSLVGLEDLRPEQGQGGSEQPNESQDQSPGSVADEEAGTENVGE